MASKGNQIAHDQLRLGEHLRVQTLHHERISPVPRTVFQAHKEGVIHIARTNRLNRLDLFRGIKVPGNHLQGLAG